MNQKDFITQVAPGAIAAHKKGSVLPSVTIAQAILESAWGKSAPGNMLFGIKWTAGCAYDKQLLWTTEYINGKAQKVQDWFRKYNSLADSVEDHGNFFLQNPRYKPVLACTNYKDACIQVQKCGYATDPNYATQLIQIIGLYKLYEYDKEEVMIKVLVNGNEVKFDAEPQMINGRVLVPVRAVAESLGATVNWDENTKTVSITKG